MRRRVRLDKRNSAAFFSGGVDSFHTLLENRETLTHLILAYGFDLPLSEEPVLRRFQPQVELTAKAFSKSLITVRTNARDHCRDIHGKHRPEFLFYQGGLLGAIALCLDGFAASVLIASPYSYDELRPNGSHPLLDPLWSSGTLHVVHHGADAKRIEKVETIAKEPGVLASLRVCWDPGPSELNCGCCEKCMRTMVALYFLGRLQQCPTLPHHIDLRQIRRLELPASSLPHWREFLDRPTHPELRRALEASIRTQEMGFGPDWGTWKSKARRSLALMRHTWADLTAGIQVLVGGGNVLPATASQTESRSDAE